jgi:4-methyl-5(b-hydroxyethyl)-thiazole monophosphate biosynthesis
MAKIGVFFGTGYEEVEALAVVDILRRGGLEVSMISITGEKYVTSSHNVTVLMDTLLDDVNFSELDMIMLPGGMPGTNHLEACEPLMKQVDTFYAEGKWIAAICAAPSIFGHKGILQGRNACSYPSFESHLTGAEVSHKPVEVSEHVITSRGMGTAIELGLTILSVFKGEEAAQKLAEAIVYKRL